MQLHLWADSVGAHNDWKKYEEQLLDVKGADCEVSKGLGLRMDIGQESYHCS